MPQDTIEGMPNSYQGLLLSPPVEPKLASRIVELLQHKGEPWLTDIRCRLSDSSRDVNALAHRDGELAAHACLLATDLCPEVAWIAHVFTAEQHRRRGLARALLAALVDRFAEGAGRWLGLETGNPAAARLYAELGFVTLQGTPGEGTAVMLRCPDPSSGDASALRDAYFEHSGEWAVQTCGREHYPALCMLFGMLAGEGKLPAMGLDTGAEAEEALLSALLSQECSPCSVLVDRRSGRPHGLACLRRDALQVYAPRVDEATESMFIQQSLWMASHPEEDD